MSYLFLFFVDLKINVNSDFEIWICIEVVFGIKFIEYVYEKDEVMVFKFCVEEV